jgi:hypothetical protein
MTGREAERVLAELNGDVWYEITCPHCGLMLAGAADTASASGFLNLDRRPGHDPDHDISRWRDRVDGVLVRRAAADWRFMKVPTNAA